MLSRRYPWPVEPHNGHGDACFCAACFGIDSMERKYATIRPATRADLLAAQDAAIDEVEKARPLALIRELTIRDWLHRLLRPIERWYWRIRCRMGWI